MNEKKKIKVHVIDKAVNHILSHRKIIMAKGWNVLILLTLAKVPYTDVHEGVEHMSSTIYYYYYYY